MPEPSDIDAHADELLLELARIDATMVQAIRRAGDGCGPDFERRLDTHARSLRTMLGPDSADVVTDAIDAAKRVMTAADPTAPLLMLAMARQTLAAVVRRQAARAPRRVA